MPNHFHFVIRIKPPDVVVGLYMDKHKTKEEINDTDLSIFISKQFSNFFNSYSKAFNKVNNRRGKLFMLPFRRKHLDSPAYLLMAIHYVHANPVNHGFVKSIYDWPYSSIHAYKINRRTNIKIEEALELFTGIEGLKLYHSQAIDLKHRLEMDF